FEPLGELNTALSDSVPRLSDDELTIYFHREDRVNDNFGNAELYVATRTNTTIDGKRAPFGPPHRIFPTIAGGRSAMVTRDGRRLYFTYGAGTTNRRQIWLSERQVLTEDFSTGRVIMEAVNDSLMAPFVTSE